MLLRLRFLGFFQLCRLCLGFLFDFFFVFFFDLFGFLFCRFLLGCFLNSLVYRRFLFTQRLFLLLCFGQLLLRLFLSEHPAQPFGKVA